jgi:hypothetical protein
MNLFMSSEKLKNLQLDFVEFPLQDYEELLEDILKNCQEGPAISLLIQTLKHDRGFRYEMIARYIPLDLDKILHLLGSFIEEQKLGEVVISQTGEDEVQRITDALTDRGKELFVAGKYAEAFNTGFAILLAIEPELPNVYDEGITYQGIIDETFGFLAGMAMGKYSPEIAALLKAKALLLFTGLNENDRYYDDEWLDLIGQFDKL